MPFAFYYHTWTGTPNSDNGVSKSSNLKEEPMAKPPPVTDTLARFVAETDFSTIPEKVLINAKRHALETLGVPLVGLTPETAAIAFDSCTHLGHSNERKI